MERPRVGGARWGDGCSSKVEVDGLQILLYVLPLLVHWQLVWRKLNLGKPFSESLSHFLIYGV